MHWNWLMSGSGDSGGSGQPRKSLVGFVRAMGDGALVRGRAGGGSPQAARRAAARTPRNWMPVARRHGLACSGMLTLCTTHALSTRWYHLCLA